MEVLISNLLLFQFSTSRIFHHKYFPFKIKIFFIQLILGLSKWSTSSFTSVEDQTRRVTRLSLVELHLSLFLKQRLGYNTVFLLLLTLIQWSYHHLDALGSIHLSDVDFLQEKYNASLDKFDNKVAARVAAIFGWAKPSSGKQIFSLHPLPSVKYYDSSNSPLIHASVKQRINDEMLNVIASLTSDISSRSSSIHVALMLAKTFLVTSRSIIDLFLT